MSYEKLTGGSGIQWPCTEKDYPNGRERLFEDGVFFTDTEYCESYGHDLETGAPVTKDQYMAVNPKGRAILKACHYIPADEMPNKEYPIALSTGRNTYHFHTRTKTGRSKKLQEASPDTEITISEEDAAEIGVKTGDQVVVESARGSIQVKASVGGINKGQSFVPFHFGYFDASDDRSRAANELTQDSWDPVSKQPRFKGGAVRIRKVDAQADTEAKEEQTQSVKKVQETKTDAEKIPVDDHRRQRHLELWLGATVESIKLFAKSCTGLFPHLVHDLEVTSGLKILANISKQTLEVLEPFVKKYHSDNSYGRTISEGLEKAVFPWHEEGKTASAYGTLAILQGLMIYLASTQGHLEALTPASQALWDKDFIAAVDKASEGMNRCQAWTKHQITVRAPQTLIVPSKVMWETPDKEGATENATAGGNPYHMEG